MEFLILGSLEVHAGGKLVSPGRPRDQLVLAALLIDAGRSVPLSRLVDALWDSDPPDTAVKQVQNSISRLRRLLAQHGQPTLIVTDHAGYRLLVAPDNLDARRFDDLVAKASRAASVGLVVQAAQLLRDAINLWRGPALAGTTGQIMEAAATALNERRRAAEDSWYDLRLALGEHREIVAELTTRVAAEPLREGAVARLMVALYRGSRRAEALAIYDRTRKLLADKLGIDPGTELRRLQHQILVDDPALDRHPREAQRSEPRTEQASAGHSTGQRDDNAIPRQLPPAIPQFVGREGEIRALDSAMRAALDRNGPAAVIAISGTAGIGKTVLALHWAHRVASQFPDGQLYVNLRGFDPVEAQIKPAHAIREFIEAFSVPPGRIPATEDAQVAFYRSLLAERRVLIVLDNARHAQQARAMLPGGPGCVVIVTSRDRLAGLVAADGALPLIVDLPSRQEAEDMLGARVGPARVREEPGSASELVRLCARLPLAVAIIAARAAVNPGLRLCDLAAELRHAGRAFDLLEADGAGDGATSLRCVFDSSYQRLSPAGARMFRLLGVHPGPDVTVAAAASLAAVPVHAARSAMAELCRSHLLTQLGNGRYTCHDLLRAYAAERADADEGQVGMQIAICRVLDHYLHSARAAALAMEPLMEGFTTPRPVPGVLPESFADHQQAMSWYEAEYQVLLASIAIAERVGLDGHAWQLPNTMITYLDWRGHWHDWTDVQRTALTAAQRLNDVHAIAQSQFGLGLALGRIGLFEPSHNALRHAAILHRRLGDRIREARALQSRSMIFEFQGRYRDGLRCAHRALGLYEAAEDEAGLVQTLNSVGWFHSLLGQYDEALRYCERALEINRAMGDARMEAYISDSVGYAHYKLGHYRHAISCFRRGIELVAPLGDRYCQAEMLTHLGDAELAADHPDLARTAWQRALAILDDLDHRDAADVRARLSALDQATGGNLSG